MAKTLKNFDWAVLSKIVIAIFGGYIISQLVSVAIVSCLPLTTGDKTLFALMISFLIFSAYVIWLFSQVSIKTIIVGSFVIALASSLVIWRVV
jgi:hypothetical protein